MPACNCSGCLYDCCRFCPNHQGSRKQHLTLSAAAAGTVGRIDPAFPGAQPAAAAAAAAAGVLSPGALLSSCWSDINTLQAAAAAAAGAGAGLGAAAARGAAEGVVLGSVGVRGIVEASVPPQFNPGLMQWGAAAGGGAPWGGRMDSGIPGAAAAALGGGGGGTGLDSIAAVWPADGQSSRGCRIDSSTSSTGMRPSWELKAAIAADLAAVADVAVQLYSGELLQQPFQQALQQQQQQQQLGVGNSRGAPEWVTSGPWGASDPSFTSVPREMLQQKRIGDKGGWDGLKYANSEVLDKLPASVALFLEKLVSAECAGDTLGATFFPACFPAAAALLSQLHFTMVPHQHSLEASSAIVGAGGGKGREASTSSSNGYPAGKPHMGQQQEDSSSSSSNLQQQQQLGEVVEVDEVVPVMYRPACPGERLCQMAPAAAAAVAHWCGDPLLLQLLLPDVMAAAQQALMQPPPPQQQQQGLGQGDGHVTQCARLWPSKGLSLTSSADRCSLHMLWGLYPLLLLFVAHLPSALLHQYGVPLLKAVLLPHSSASAAGSGAVSAAGWAAPAAASGRADTARTAPAVAGGSRSRSCQICGHPGQVLSHQAVVATGSRLLLQPQLQQLLLQRLPLESWLQEVLPLMLAAALDEGASALAMSMPSALPSSAAVAAVAACGGAMGAPSARGDVISREGTMQGLSKPLGAHAGQSSSNTCSRKSHESYVHPACLATGCLTATAQQLPLPLISRHMLLPLLLALPDTAAAVAPLTAITLMLHPDQAVAHVLDPVLHMATAKLTDLGRAMAAGTVCAAAEAAAAAAMGSAAANAVLVLMRLVGQMSPSWLLQQLPQVSDGPAGARLAGSAAVAAGGGGGYGAVQPSSAGTSLSSSYEGPSMALAAAAAAGVGRHSSADASNVGGTSTSSGNWKGVHYVSSSSSGVSPAVAAAVEAVAAAEGPEGVLQGLQQLWAAAAAGGSSSSNTGLQVLATCLAIAPVAAGAALAPAAGFDRGLRPSFDLTVADVAGIQVPEGLMEGDAPALNAGAAPAGGRGAASARPQQQQQQGLLAEGVQSLGLDRLWDERVPGQVYPHIAGLLVGCSWIAGGAALVKQWLLPVVLQPLVTGLMAVEQLQQQQQQRYDDRAGSGGGGSRVGCVDSLSCCWQAALLLYAAAIQICGLEEVRSRILEWHSVEVWLHARCGWEPPSPAAATVGAAGGNGSGGSKDNTATEACSRNTITITSSGSSSSTPLQLLDTRGMLRSLLRVPLRPAAAGGAPGGVDAIVGMGHTTSNPSSAASTAAAAGGGGGGGGDRLLSSAFLRRAVSMSAASAGGQEGVTRTSATEAGGEGRAGGSGGDLGVGGGGGLRPSELMSLVSAEAEAARALTTTSDFLEGHGWSSPLGQPASLVISLSGEMGRAAAAR